MTDSVTPNSKAIPPGERIVFICLIVLSICFAFGAALNYQHIAGALKPVAVVGSNPTFRGDMRSPYTLVEFGDYQCSPCRVANRRLPYLLNKYSGKVRFTFRNLPLVEIHEAAMPAAIAAEAARVQGKFWQMHDHLYEGTSLDVLAVDESIAAVPLNRRRFQQDSVTIARHAVALDLTEAQALGLNGTPSFLLCCPSGNVVHLNSLDDLETIVK